MSSAGSGAAGSSGAAVDVHGSSSSSSSCPSASAAGTGANYRVSQGGGGGGRGRQHQVHAAACRAGVVDHDRGERLCLFFAHRFHKWDFSLYVFDLSLSLFWFSDCFKSMSQYALRRERERNDASRGCECVTPHKHTRGQTDRTNNNNNKQRRGEESRVYCRNE